MIAGLRSGLISFSCDKCLDAPYIKDTLGCDGPTQAPARWLDENEEWFNCPIKFIKQDALDFLDKFDSYKNNISTPPDYENQAARFLEAVGYFNSCVNRYTEIKQGK